MNVSRESVMSALVAKLQGAAFAAPVNGKTSFVSISRRLKLWADVPKSLRPAMFITNIASNSLSERSVAGEDDAECRSLHLYRRQRHERGPAISLNVIMDAIEARCARAMDNNRQTLAAWSPIAASTARS